MSSIASIASPAFATANEFVQTGYHYAQEAYQNLTHRDRSKAALGIMTHVQEMGELEYVGEPTFMQPTDTIPASIDQIARIRRGEHIHQLRITRALCSQDDPDEAYLALPGITLDPSKPGTAHVLHDKLVENAGGATVVSVNTEYIGDYESHGSLRQIVGLSFKQMAEARLDIGRKLFADKPVHGVGNSMGAMILGYTAFANMQRPAETQLNLVDLSLVKPAIVTPDQARRILAGHFLPNHLKKSAAIEGGWLPYVKGLRRQDWFPRPCLGNALQLSYGIPEDVLKSILTKQKVGLQVGEIDPLNQPELYERLREISEGNFELKVYAERGHSILDHASEIISDLRHFTRLGRYPVAGAFGDALGEAT